MESRNLTCLFCERSFKTLQHFLKHLLCHIRERSYFCTKCNSEFPESRELDRHIRRGLCFWSIRHVCAFCQQGFQSKKARWKHLTTHTSGKFCCCSSCSSRNEDDELIGNQMRTHPLRLECIFCDMKFVHEISLEIHMSKHTREKPYFCVECPLESGMKSSLLSHLRTHSSVDSRSFVCQICSKKFHTKHLLEAHTLVHIPDKPFPCRICKKRFKTKQNCTKHEKYAHAATKDFKCSDCELKFTIKARLRAHIKTVHAEKTFSCEICEKKFSVARYLKQHIRNHVGKATNVCPVCNKTYVWKCDLDRHISKNLPSQSFDTDEASSLTSSEPGRDDGKFYCVFCDGWFSNKQQFFNHLISHTKERPYFCEICKTEFSTQGHIKHHVKGNCCFKSEQHVCPFCHQGFGSKKTRSKHLNTHVTGKVCCCKQCSDGSANAQELRIQMRPNPISCECLFCNKLFRHRSSLDDHLLMHTLEKPCFCLKCGKEFGLKTTLFSHMRTHSATRTKSYCCPMCDNRFETKQGLEIHTRSHIGDRPFQCSTCGKSFKSLGNVKIHQKSHSSVRDFKCEHCPLSFKFKSGLNMHNKRFHMEKRINCEICNEKFPTTENLKYHMIHHTGELAYGCRICYRRFARKGGLKRHIKSLHKSKRLN